MPEIGVVLLCLMVVLSVGMEASSGTKEMAELFGVKLNQYKFIETIGGALNTVGTSVQGVFACGAATGPADLEDSISSASAKNRSPISHSWSSPLARFNTVRIFP